MNEYQNRRKRLAHTIGETSIAILPAAPAVIRNNDAHYFYRQNSDFYYLTGFNEPDAVLILAPNRKEGEYILFNRVRNREHEIWDGPRAGQEGARQSFLADQAFPIDNLPNMLPELLAGRTIVHCTLGQYTAFDKLIFASVNQLCPRIRSGAIPSIAFVDITDSLHEMRLIKSTTEIAMMQKAVDISEKAHIRAMQACHPGMYEYQLEAELDYEFKRHGAHSPAYTSIVGSGKNTCILHHVLNDAVIKDSDLILIDAGAEYQNYASDITRTFPANGRFSAEQRAIYELVLAAQLAGIETVTPQNTFTDAQIAIVQVITQGLADLGILKGSMTELIEKRAYLPFYMHRSGHWLGLDVHDAGHYQQNGTWRRLEAGMVLTMEPGIYISADIPGVHKRWQNIGVRIEDDVLVTAEGREVLSQRIPKRIDEIETIMAK